MKINAIITDDTLRKIKNYGNANFPFEYYYDYICSLNNHLIDWHGHDEFEWIYAKTNEVECNVGKDTFI